jgi:hypothetical protein
VDDPALPVDGLPMTLRGFRKSHHFVPASSDIGGRRTIGELQTATARHVSACRAGRVRTTLVSEFL